MPSSVFQIDKELLYLSAELSALTKYPKERAGCMSRIDEMLDLRLIMMRMHKTTRRAICPPTQPDPNLRSYQ